MKYVIANIEDLDNIDFNQVIQTSKETVRKSIDGSLFILKFKGVCPDFLNKYDKYNSEEIRTILSTPEWTEIIEL